MGREILNAHFLTLLRHESCGSACLVDSECSFPPYLLSVLQYHLRVRSCLYALAIFFFLIVSPADFLDSSACKLVYLLLSLLFFLRATSLLASACSRAGLSLRRPAYIESVLGSVAVVVYCVILLLVALSACFPLFSTVGRSPFII